MTVKPPVTTENANISTPSQVAQDASDVAFNERQKAFDLANPAGTKIEDIKALTQEQIVAQQGTETFVPTVAPVAPVTPAPVAPVAPVVPSAVPETVTAPVETVSYAAAPVATVPTPKPETFTPKTPEERRKELGALAEVPKTASETEQERIDLENAKSESGQKMLANVATMAVSTPDILKDRSVFESMTSYGTKPESEKRLLDAYWQSKNAPKTEKEYFDTLLSGQDVFNKNLKLTTEYSRAKSRFERFSRYASMDSNALYGEMVAGNVPSDFSNPLSASNPAYQEAKKRYDQYVTTKSINDNVSSIGRVLSDKKSQTPDYVSDLSKFFETSSGGKTASELFKEHVSGNPKVREMSEKLSAKNEELQTLSDARDRIVKDVKKNYSGLPASLQIAYASRLAEPIVDQYNALNREAVRLSSDLKFETEMSRDEYAASLKDLELLNDVRKENRGYAFQVIQGQIGEDRAKRLANYERDLNLETKRLERIMEEGDINSKDPTLRRRAIEKGVDAIIKQYADVPMVRSREQMVNDIQKMVDSGKDLGTALSDNIIRPIQSKPEYKRKVELTLGQLSDREKFALQKSVQESQESRSFARQKELARFNNDISREKFLFELENDPEKQEKIAELELKMATDSPYWALLGNVVGTYEGNRGIDLAGKIGDPLPAGGNWKVESVIDANFQSSPYGNSVLLKDSDTGETIRVSHLQKIGVKPGDSLSFGDVIGTRGNTGNVRGAGGEKLTPAQLAAGRGAHFDIEIKDPKGRLLSQTEQKIWLQSRKPSGVSGPEITSTDIARFNNPTFKPNELKTNADKQKYALFTEKKKLFDDPDADFYDIIELSEWSGKGSVSEREKVGKYAQVLGGLETLTGLVNSQETGPVVGRIKQLDPYSVDVAQFKAQIAGLVPTVARGVFNEVGVLTDSDVARYLGTLPTLEKTQDQNKLVIAAMLSTLRNGMKSQLDTMSRSGVDVSKFVGSIKKMDETINRLESEVGVSKNTDGWTSKHSSLYQSIGYGSSSGGSSTPSKAGTYLDSFNIR